jgi:2-polyprenyl-3-methyl-5-hydroxy-6-metoxy-1,4-benzoquinol methylase
MSHEHVPDMADMFTREFWDARYLTAAKIWSGEPNPRLVEHTSDLPPGTALDAGSGEGADAIWLASQGWRVTAVDVSTVALDRAAARAAEAGMAVADRISWQQADLLSWDPPAQQFDLVSAQFMQLPRAARDTLHRRLAAAVRPGGTLLIVGHHPSDLQTTARRPHFPELFFTAEEVAAALDPDAWTVVLAAPAERAALDGDGLPITVHDAVLRAVRTSS